jgi:dihydroxyacetone kinase DhaKLM complex PTS-EIIA-like component DhaM
MRILIVLILSILFNPFGQAQIMESAKVMSQGDNNALTVKLPDTEVKVVEKEWESFIKGYKGKLRKIKKSSEIFADDAKLENISSNTVDVYALVSERGEDTELSVWFDLGGAYLNSETHPEQYNHAKVMLNDFLGKVSKTYIANLLNEEEKKMKDLEGVLKDIEKSSANSVKDIEKFEEKIQEAKANIEKCKSDKEGALKDIDAQKAVIKKVKMQLKG